MGVEVANESGVEVDVEALSEQARFLLDRLRIHHQAELSVVLVDDNFTTIVTAVRCLSSGCPFGVNALTNPHAVTAAMLEKIMKTPAVMTGIELPKRPIINPPSPLKTRAIDALRSTRRLKNGGSTTGSGKGGNAGGWDGFAGASLIPQPTRITRPTSTRQLG